MDPARFFKRALKTLIQAIVLTMVGVVTATLVNAVRPEPLPWVAAPDFVNLIYTDCPETEAVAESLGFATVAAERERFLIVDSRPTEEFETGHIAGALSVPYDSLFAVTKDDLARVRTNAKAKTVVVVGEADQARELAAEMVSNGLKNVFYLEDGANWRKLMDGAPKENEVRDAE